MKFENWTIDELFERCIDTEDGSVFMNSDEVAALRRKIAELRSTQPVSGGYKLPEGFKLVPVESTDAWAERYCELTNKHPDGGLTTYIGDGAVTITFREKSKREIDAMLAAAPEGGNG